MPIYDAKSIPAEVNSGTKDPEVAAFLKTGPVLGAHKPIHEQRVEHNAFIDEIKPPIGGIEHLVLDGPHGSLPVRVYYPSKPGPAEGGALIYVHGGGFIVGTLDQFDTAMRLFCEISGAQVYGVDYKLAPEYQWPTQIEEVEFVVRWLVEHAAERGLDRDRIGLGGDSAGGNITCTVCLKLRDENGPKLALQMPIYPEAEMPFFTRAGVENVSGGYVDTAGVLLFVWCLVPQGVDYSQPYITPMNAKSHAGLPKAILVTAGFDMLRDVAHRYAQKLARDGNDITYVHYPDLSHAFIQMTAHSKRCLESTQEVARLLGKGLAKAQCGDGSAGYPAETATMPRVAARSRREKNWEVDGRHGGAADARRGVQLDATRITLAARRSKAIVPSCAGHHPNRRPNRHLP